MSDLDREHWSMDKRVPLALIVTLAAQTFGVVWWASRMSSQQDEIKRRIETIEQERSAVKIAERLAVLESQMAGTTQTLHRLEGYLRRLEDRPDGIGAAQSAPQSPRNGRRGD